MVPSLTYLQTTLKRLSQVYVCELEPTSCEPEDGFVASLAEHLEVQSGTISTSTLMHVLLTKTA